MTVVLTHCYQVPILLLYTDSFRQASFQLPLGTLYRNNVSLNIDLHFFWKRDRFSSYSGHNDSLNWLRTDLPDFVLPNLTQHFATHALSARLATRHNSARGGQNIDTHST